MTGATVPGSNAGANAPRPITTLRDWLDHLAARDRLAVIKPNVALKYELAAIAKRLDGVKATVFPRPDGHAMPVISGLVSDRQWIADAMGVEPGEVLARFQDAALNPLPWREVANAPAQEIVHREIDLGTPAAAADAQRARQRRLHHRRPVDRAQSGDRHPERLDPPAQLSGPNRLGALLLPRHTHMFYEAAERAGEPLDVAIVIGVDPLTLLSSQAIAPIDFDELTIAGALHGAPLRVAKCVTNAVRVPADAEIVVEGRLLPRVREPEGPFGEFPQYYGERAERHVIEVTAVTQRRDALFHTIVGGGLEHLLLGGIPREATLLAHLRRSFPNVRDVHLSRGGVCRYHLHVQINKRQEGEAKNVMLGAFAGHYDVKHVTVVDEDVDIHNPAEVEWAVATRFQADRDLVIVPEAQGSKLDPSTRDGVGAKMGLDATRPLDADEMKFKRIRVPGEEDLRLDDLIRPGPAVDWRIALSRGSS